MNEASPGSETSEWNGESSSSASLVADADFEVMPTEVRVAAGTTAYLSCRPRSLRNKTVIWPVSLLTLLCVCFKFILDWFPTTKYAGGLHTWWEWKRLKAARKWWEKPTHFVRILCIESSARLLVSGSFDSFYCSFRILGRLGNIHHTSFNRKILKKTRLKSPCS